MPARPQLKDIYARIQADLEGRLEQSNPRLRRSVLAVLARMEAGGMHALYGYLDFILLQAIPDTAVDEFLERWAHVWGVDRLAGAKATGSIEVTGQEGFSVPVGAELQNIDGVVFVTTTGITLDITQQGSVDVEAKEVGVAGNVAADDPLFFISPIPGIDAEAVAGSISGGRDFDNDEALRARLLRRIQQPALGGAARDYLNWALEVPGVTRAWVYPNHAGVGTVGLTFAVDDAPDPIPDAAKVTEVEEYIEERRPITAQVLVFAPINTPLDFELAVVPDTPAVRAAVEAELRDLISRASPNSTIYRTHIGEAISRSAGEVNHTITQPAADVVYAANELPTFGEITWL